MKDVTEEQQGTWHISCLNQGYRNIGRCHQGMKGPAQKHWSLRQLTWSCHHDNIVPLYSKAA